MEFRKTTTTKIEKKITRFGFDSYNRPTMVKTNWIRKMGGISLVELSFFIVVFGVSFVFTVYHYKLLSKQLIGEYANMPLH